MYIELFFDIRFYKHLVIPVVKLTYISIMYSPGRYLYMLVLFNQIRSTYTYFENVRQVRLYYRNNLLFGYNSKEKEMIYIFITLHSSLNRREPL